MSQLIEFAARLKAARELAGYKRAIQLARELGIDKTRYSHYEGGRRLPSDAMIMDMCERIGINPQWLKTGTGEPFNETTLQDKEKSDKQKLDQLIELKLNKIDRSASKDMGKKNQSNLDEALLTELIISIGKIKKNTALKICSHYKNIIANEEDPAQRIKLARTLLSLLEDN